MSAAVVWFPVAGALIGLVVGAAAGGLWHVVPPLLAGTVAVAIGLLITGAFHEDGLGDVADAFGGGLTVDRRLEIMKDSRHGTYGVAAIVTSIALRCVALGSIPTPLAMLAGCIVSHCLARAAALALMGTMPPVRHAGLGADYGRTTSARRASVGVIVAVFIATGCCLLIGRWWWVAAAVCAAAVGGAATGALAWRKIGGVSGDVLGAAEQVAESLILVTLVALITG